MFSSFLCLLLAQDAYAIPLQMNHQGRLLDNDGNGLTGSHELIFRIMDDPEDGYALYTETQTVNFINGYYSVLLGADEENNPLDDSVFANYPLYLALKVDGENLEPRQPMTSVPYAQIAGVAESVDGGVVNASEVTVGGQAVINADGQWVGEAPTVDFMNLQNRPQGLDDGDDNTQLDQTEVVGYVNGSQMNLGAASQVDGSDIVTAGSFNGYLPTDLADGDNDLLTSISCGVGELISWDGNASWACVSDNTLELADIETLLANNPMDLNATTTIGGLDIVTSIEDSDTLASLSCQNDGEIARYDLVLDEWYCDTDIDTDTVLDQAGVLAHVNGEALSLASGTQVNGSDVVTVDTFVSNLPSDLADGDADTQLDSATVVSYVESGSVNLAQGSQVNSRNIVGQPSVCTNGQVLVYNSSSNDWECGDDTDTTLTPTEMQTMIEALSLNLQNVPQVNGADVLTVDSVIDPTNIDANSANNGQILTVNNGTASWVDSEEDVGSCSETMHSHNDGSSYIFADCDTHSYVLKLGGATNFWSGNSNCTTTFLEYHNNGVISLINCGNSSHLVHDSHRSDMIATSVTSTDSESVYCALLANGNAKCWGSSWSYSSGLSGIEFQGPFIELLSSQSWLAALDSNGDLTFFGGNNDNIQSDAPNVSFTQIDGTSQNICGLDSNGTIHCWGYPWYDLNNTPSGTFTSLSIGSDFGCALNNNGEITCWGRDYEGQVSNAPSGSFESIHVDSNRACALDASGTAYCWGANYTNALNSPPNESFLSFSESHYGSHRCGIKSDNKAVCWGSDNHGQVSDVPDVEFMYIGTGRYHTCGLDLNGTVHCWGIDDGTPGRYGDNGQVSDVPNTTFTQLFVGDLTNCGVIQSGNVVCWGLDGENSIVSGVP